MNCKWQTELTILYYVIEACDMQFADVNSLIDTNELQYINICKVTSCNIRQF